LTRVLEVQKPGLFTTVQDLGRFGFLRYGVPIVGAMDTFSFTAANCLVGNSLSDACLEITLIGPELHVLRKTQITIAGGTISPKINGQDVPMWQTLTVEQDDILSFGRMEAGCRAYLAIRGSINVPQVLGSRSTYVRGGFGGINGRQLRTGDVLEGFGTRPLEAEYSLPEALIPQFTNSATVKVVLGPQVDMFTDEGLQTFLSSEYVITSEADRMGYRLDGAGIQHKAKTDIISDAILPGAIQVPKDGKPIIMMRDAQTTGGYPKIAAVTTPDLCLLAEARINSTVRFAKIGLQQAQEEMKEYIKLLDSLDKRLVRNS
jgi:biotin-dependent carboxylase-like uncharacterized protein